jgi:hypothetical protein
MAICPSFQRKQLPDGTLNKKAELCAHGGWNAKESITGKLLTLTLIPMSVELVFDHSF